MEDTLSLQLKRIGWEYASLAGDSVVALASLSVTLVSRRRLAVNGMVESLSRLLLRSIGGLKGVGDGCDDGTRTWEANLEAVRNLVSQLSQPPLYRWCRNLSSHVCFPRELSACLGDDAETNNPAICRGGDAHTAVP